MDLFVLNRLRKRAREVRNDLKTMRVTARNAAKEKIGQMGENAAELYGHGRDKAKSVSIAAGAAC
jgi:hypothetical protein